MKSKKAKPTGAPKQPARVRRSSREEYPDKATLEALNVERDALQIYLVEIAREAVKTTRRRRRTCSISTVSKVFSGDTKSWNVLNAYKRLRAMKIAAREAGAKGAESAA